MDEPNMITETNKIKVNDLLAIIYYVKVTESIPHSDKIVVQDVDNPNNKMAIQGKEVLQNSYSADQYDREEKISKTAAAEILVSSCSQPFTVSFTKDDGKERVLRGRLVRPESLLGRSLVEDLDISGPVNKRLRQVDHRTLNWLIINNVKYSVYK